MGSLEQEFQNKVWPSSVADNSLLFSELFLEGALFCEVCVQIFFVLEYFANVVSFSFFKSVHREFQSGLAL